MKNLSIILLRYISFEPFEKSSLSNVKEPKVSNINNRFLSDLTPETLQDSSNFIDKLNDVYQGFNSSGSLWPNLVVIFFF
jgi:hypothetical protein